MCTVTGLALARLERVAFLSSECVSGALLDMQVHGSWMGNGFPHPGTSYGRSTQYMMGTSPYGKSVDMVDVCTKLMEGAILPCSLHGACVSSAGWYALIQ